jgi:hypothetical protein
MPSFSCMAFIDICGEALRDGRVEAKFNRKDDIGKVSKLW